jgi:hypothetical protein
MKFRRLLFGSRGEFITGVSEIYTSKDIFKKYREGLQRVKNKVCDSAQIKGMLMLFVDKKHLLKSRSVVYGASA